MIKLNALQHSQAPPEILIAASSVDGKLWDPLTCCRPSLMDRWFVRWVVGSCLPRRS